MGTADQEAFRDRVLAAHIARTKAKRGSPQRDLRGDELKEVPGTAIKTSPDTATAAGQLLAAANMELARAQKAGDADALRTIRLGATSGYRSSEYQRDLWRRYFSAKGGYYDRTQDARERLSDGRHSNQAAAFLLRPKRDGGFGLGGRIAAPGYSNHQGGIAVDFSQERKKGYAIGNKSDDATRRRWRDSWFHRWLKTNAATYGFQPIPTEEWHWEYRRGSGASTVVPQPSALASLPSQIANMVRTGGLALKVALAMLAGERDVTKLTSMLFFLRYPERGGARIRPEETQLAQEWKEIRDRIVKPALERLSATAPATLPQPSQDVPATGAAAAAPVGPFGTLTIEAPEKLRLQYQFTPDDVLWTARLVEGEAGGEDNPENVAVVWALVNRFGIFRKDLPDKTFADFIQRYSTTLQPYLRNPDAISRAMETSRRNPDKPALQWVALGGTFLKDGKEYPKGQYQKHLSLQRKSWNQLKKGSRLVAERVLGGHVTSPVGIASDFDGTHIFLNRNLTKAGRNPSTIPPEEYRRLWVDFTHRHAKKKNRIWIGEDAPGIRQMKSNAFYIHPRSKDLPAGTVGIVPARRH